MSSTDNAQTKRSHKNIGIPPEIAIDRLPFDDKVDVTIELLSPMLGGGAVPRQADTVGWLRPSAVKGHLRFWWRALHAHTFPNVGAMREKERSLFGAPGTFRGNEVLGGPGVVRIYVDSARHSQRSHRVQGAKQNSLPPGIIATLGLTFDRQSAKQEREQIEAALIAWLVFGGSGGRTRRAAGALGVMETSLANMPRSRTDLESYLKGLFALRPRDGTLGAAAGCFALARLDSILIGPTVDSGAQAASGLQVRFSRARKTLEPLKQSRLGNIRPRHASPVVLSVIATIDQPRKYSPLVLVTRPHVGTTPEPQGDTAILNALVNDLCADNALVRIEP